MKGPVPLFAVTVLAASRAAAAEGPRLDYSRGPAACLEESEFRREVAIAGDGADLFSASAPDVLRVSFEQLGAGTYRGSLTYTDAAGHTEPATVLVYGVCEVLGRMVAISARDYVPKPLPVLPPPASPATQDPAPASLTTQVPAPVPAATQLPLPAPAAPAKTFQRVAPSPAEQVSVDFTLVPSAAFVLSLGLTANPAPGFAIGAALRRDRFSVGFEVRGLPPSPIVLGDKFPGHDQFGPPRSTEASQWTGVLVPCIHLSYFAGCAAVQGGGFVVKDWYGDGVITGGIFTVGPRAGVVVPLGERFSASLYGELPFNIVRQHFIDDVGVLATNRAWNMSLVYGVVGAQLAASFQ